MKYVNLSEWLDTHKVFIDELGRDYVAEACYDAMYDILREDYYSLYVSDNKSEIASELLSQLPKISPSDFLELINRFIEKKEEDWRILISDNFDGESGYESFYLEHKSEFAEWLKKQGKEFRDDMDYYLNEGVDELLEFAYEYLGGKDAIDVVSGIRDIAVLDKIDIMGFIEANEEELLNILEEMIDDYLSDTEWFIEWVMDSSDFDEGFHDYITPDDYYPMASYAYEFPTSLEASELNKLAPAGLVFFELNGVVYVSLTTVGMSMMPALYYAYFMYSDLNIDAEEIAQNIVSLGPSYYKYVIGEQRLIELVKAIGYNLKELERISREMYERFQQRLEELEQARNNGKLTNLEAALLIAMELLRKPSVDSSKS